MGDSRYYEKAKKKVEEKKKFHNHLRSYIIVNLIMLVTGVFFRSRGGWIIAAFFWGIGLFFHYVKAYGFMGMGADDEWEEQEIEREVKKMKRRAKYHRSKANSPHEDEMDDYLDLNTPKSVPQKKYDEEDLV